jgi:DNA transformation protein
MVARADSFKEFVLDQLSDLRSVSCRAMFGGYGLYQGDVFFGIIHKSRLYLKTNDRTRAAYLRHGSKPFQPNRKQTLNTYYEVPVEIIEDQDRLVEWAERSAGFS